MKSSILLVVLSVGLSASAAISSQDIEFSLSAVSADGVCTNQIKSSEMLTVNRTDGEIIWKGHPMLGAEFTVKSTLTKVEDGTQWEFEYSGNDSGVRMAEIAFPIWKFKRTNQARTFFVKHEGGVHYPNWANLKAEESVDRGDSLAPGLRLAAILENNRPSHYVDLRGDARKFDSAFYFVQGTNTSSQCAIRVVHKVRQEIGVRAYKLPYPGVLAEFTGGWFEACEIYRDWAKRQEWYEQAKGEYAIDLKSAKEWDNVPAMLAVYGAAIGKRSALEGLSQPTDDTLAAVIARGVTWGLKPSCADGCEYSKQAEQFVRENDDLFSDGTMLSPGVLYCEEDGANSNLPKIFRSAWQAKSGRRAMILGNWTKEDQAYEFVQSGKVYKGNVPSRSWARIDLDREGVKDMVLQGEFNDLRPVTTFPFPDRLSAYVWRNWFVVPHSHLAVVIGAKEVDLERIAAEMGLPKKVDVSKLWRTSGYITVLRRNWHLLDYPQLMAILGKSRKELYISIKEDDFLWTKVGNLKPHCGTLRWSERAEEFGRNRRREIADIVRSEKIDDFSEEPRFRFVDDLKRIEANCKIVGSGSDSPFDLRMISSYFADYGDPLADEEIRSFPEGLLQKLANQGVNAVWMHVVLNTLAKDPKYPEFGEGSERRIANLRKLVERTGKYGIRVYLYLNEPRAQPSEFFEKNDERKAMRGVCQRSSGVCAMCTSHPESLRWVRDSVAQVFRLVPGLGGVFTITMSENLTNCGAKFEKDLCKRCRSRSYADLIAEQNIAIVDGVKAGSDTAEVVVYDWSWPDAEEPEILKRLPRERCRVMAVSEGRMNICRGGVPVRTHDYSISCVGPSEKTREFWSEAKKNGIGTVAKVQAGTSWELSIVPYLPTMDLIAEHASNLVREGVGGVLLSWSLGGAPSPNLRVFQEIGKDGNGELVLDKLSKEIYGNRAAPYVRKAWKEFSDGFRNFPFDIWVLYLGPFQWGAANPLYPECTGYEATMVGFPYDDFRFWRSVYPESVWISLTQSTADGFLRGCEIWDEVIAEADTPARKALAKKERGIFKVAALHFDSGADQARFVQARNAGRTDEVRMIALRELARAKEELDIVRADSRVGFESSNQYMFIPQDLREKIVSCRLLSK